MTTKEVDQNPQGSESGTTKPPLSTFAAPGVSLVTQRAAQAGLDMADGKITSITVSPDGSIVTYKQSGYDNHPGHVGPITTVTQFVGAVLTNLYSVPVGKRDTQKYNGPGKAPGEPGSGSVLGAATPAVAPVAPTATLTDDDAVGMVGLMDPTVYPVPSTAQPVIPALAAAGVGLMLFGIPGAIAGGVLGYWFAPKPG